LSRRQVHSAEQARAGLTSVGVALYRPSARAGRTVFFMRVFSEEVQMATAKKAAKKSRRTVLYSSGGKKLYAVRDAGGKFKDIQQYARAHAMDIKRGSKAEATTAAKKATKKVVKKVVKKSAAAKTGVVKAVKKTAAPVKKTVKKTVKKAVKKAAKKAVK
jgi:hypothetical protein